MNIISGFADISFGQLLLVGPQVDPSRTARTDEIMELSLRLSLMRNWAVLLHSREFQPQRGQTPMRLGSGGRSLALEISDDCNAPGGATPHGFGPCGE